LETVTKNKLYEGMFLVDSSLAGSDWDGIISAIKKTLEKAKAEVVSIVKWDDRKLAYDIEGKSRGTYILSYFRVDGERIKDIEKSVRLSEKIMRVLILNAEKLSQEDIEKETPAMKQEKGKQEEGEETSTATDEESVSTTEEFEEVETEEDFEQTEESGKLPEKDVNAAAGVSMVTEEVTENPLEGERIEDFEQADEKEPF
jgi:small subunit ribosomal protein S6